MINENVHKKPVGLDRDKHRTLRLNTQAADPSMSSHLNAVFVAAAEFAAACRELPVVWVRAGNGPDGKPAIASIAMTGLKTGQNLCQQADGRWRTQYVPAMLRFYPFAMVRVSDTQLVVVIDESWSGFSRTEGQALFEADGSPTEFLKGIQTDLEKFEMEIERTRLAGEKLQELGLLRDMRFDATLPDGSKVGVDGFMTIDDEKLAALTDAQVVELHRSGLLGLIHAHQISLGNTQKLVQWMLEGAAAAPAPPTPA
jgi:hypothetical protein